MKQKPSIGQRISTVCMLIAIVAFVALSTNDLLHLFHNIDPYMQFVFFGVFGIYLLLSGLTKINLSRRNERDFLWYKRYNLTRGLATLFLGVSYYTFIFSRFLPDKVGTIIEGSGLILLVLPSIIFYVLSLKAAQYKVEAE